MKWRRFTPERRAGAVSGSHFYQEHRVCHLELSYVGQAVRVTPP
jgi:hypothetical protein